MDILLDRDGDLYISPQGDISIGNSVSQKIRIVLLWLAGEWRWDKEEGLPYMGTLFLKSPDTDTFESLIRSRIFAIEEVTEVKDVRVEYDAKNRSARIQYTVLTDYETIKEELGLNAGLWGD